jgi:hypothetical protein
MMNKLTEFYSHRKALAEQEEQSPMNELTWAAMEDKLIQEEVLPEVAEALAPILRRVQSPLSLHVDYTPQGTLSVSFHRNVAQLSLADLPTDVTAACDAADAEEATPAAVQEDVTTATTEQQEEKKAARMKIRVTTPEGKVIYYNKVWWTLRDVILYAGIGRVQALGLREANVPLVSDHLEDSNYAKAQHEIAPGVYLFTNTSTPTKLKELNIINEKLGLGMTIKTE